MARKTAAGNLGKLPGARIASGPQAGEKIPSITVKKSTLEKHPILAYRERNLKEGKPARGNPVKRCGLVLDDMAVMGNEHFPCIIYMREGGRAIGKISQRMRLDRKLWFEDTDCTVDKICSKNCLDVCVDYNRKYSYFHS